MERDPSPQPAPTGPGTSGRREVPLLDVQPIGPWAGRVRVTPITRLVYMQTETQYEVRADWTGPPLPGFPPSEQAVEAADTYLTESYEFAKALAGWARDQLRRPAVPDLRVRVRELGARVP